MVFIIHVRRSELTKITPKELEEQLVSRKMDYGVSDDIYSFKTSDFEELRTFKGIVDGELKIA